MPRVSTHGAVGRLLHSLLGRPAFWVVAVALLFGVPVARSVLRGMPAPPPRLGRVAPPDPSLAGRPYIAGETAARATLVALHRRLARLGDGFSIVEVGAAAIPPGHSPRIWHAVARAPSLPCAGRLWLVDAGGELRGRYDPADRAARDALVAAVGLLVNGGGTR